MGGWAVYCAICGGPFSSQVEMDPEGTDERSYRYDVLKDCDLEWLDELCALGMNPDATGDDKCVICWHLVTLWTYSYRWFLGLFSRVLATIGTL